MASFSAIWAALREMSLSDVVAVFASRAPLSSAAGAVTHYQEAIVALSGRGRQR